MVGGTMKNILLKDTIKEIKSTRKRFISILLIILLGAGFFAGIKAISPDMKKAADKYFDESNFMDFRLLSTLGMTEDDIKEIEKIDGIKNVEPAISIDALIKVDDKESVIKLHTLPMDKGNLSASYLNELELIDGRMPKKDNECVIDSKLLEYSNYKLGEKLEIIIPDEEMSEKMSVKEFVIVGEVKSPMYMSLDRGTSSLGSGKVLSFVYIPDTVVDTDVYTEIYVNVEGADKYLTFSKEYEEYIKSYADELEELGKIRKDIRYNEIVVEGKNKLDEAKKKLDESKTESDKKILEANQKIKEAQDNINLAQIRIQKEEEEANAKFKEAEEQLSAAKAELAVKEEEFDKQKEKYEPLIESASSVIQGLEYSLSILDNLIEKNEEAISQKTQQKEENEARIQELTNSLNDAPDSEKEIILEEIARLSSSNAELTTQIEFRKKENEYMRAGKESINEKLPVLKEELNTNKRKLEEANELLNSAKSELASKEEELNNSKIQAYAMIDNAKRELQIGRNNLEANKKLLEEETKNAEAKINEAEEKIKEARDKLDEVKEPKWYVLDRNKNAGYFSYSQDSDRIAAIAQVFPVMFFVVAALVSLTSMTRMVEEQRGQIGLLKALGYSKYKIAQKYVLYSLLASVIGSIIGILIGFKLLPTIVFNVYGMLYNMPPTFTEFNLKYAILAIIVSVFCTTFATILACIKELREVPAALMRPRAPKKGKRILLEKIPFIWNKFNFTAKVTARNIFRYKKRFLMTIIGIGGCTGLLLVGFGLKDSITSMIPMQFEDIFNYKLDISLKDGYTEEEFEKLENTLKNINEIKEYAGINEHAITFEKDDIQKEGQMVVVENVDNFSKYINLQDRSSKEKINFENDSVIITEKVAKMLNVKVGDSIKIKNSDEEMIELEITDITENYIYHYIYISEEKYEEIYKEKANINKLIVNVSDDIEKSRKSEITTTLLENKILTNATFTSDTFDLFDDAMESLNSIVLILIVSAGMLAFVVLYNLSNINISERVRELATIKVLGFYDREVTSYVYRENVVLTIIGAILGIGIGYFLNDFIITTCEVDLVMFARVIKPLSYILAIAITLIFSVIVNIATHFALKKIDMIESLKSVE